MRIQIRKADDRICADRLMKKARESQARKNGAVLAGEGHRLLCIKGCVAKDTQPRIFQTMQYAEGA
jgi:hypothetical protein